MPPEFAGTVGKEDPKLYIRATISSFPFAQKYGVTSANRLGHLTLD
jgi:hypothetical protein